MRLRRRIPAGLIDSATASLATFIVGLYAIRSLDPQSLGAYALVFAAFATLMEASARLVFLPAEIDAAKRPQTQRLGALAHSLRQGTIIAVPAGLVVGAAALVIPREVSGDVVAALTIGAMGATVLSPIQDHIRRMLHIGNRSWTAASVSLIQLGTIPVALVGMSTAAISVAWHPFGALAIANLVSTCVGLLIWLRVRPQNNGQPVPLRILLRSGRWLVAGSMTPGLGAFGAASLVAHLAGAQALGFAEAARVLGRPITVLSQGLTAVIGPDLMRAGASRNRSAGRRYSRLYVFLIAGLGLSYLALTGSDWLLNPFRLLVPQAYVIGGLTAAFIAVYILDRVAGAGAWLQLLGAGRQRALAAVEIVASSGHVLGGLTAPITGAFAMPLGYFITSIIRRVWMRRLLRNLYSEHVPPRDAV